MRIDFRSQQPRKLVGAVKFGALRARKDDEDPTEEIPVVDDLDQFSETESVGNSCFEMPTSWVAGGSDIGYRHEKNEDAMMIWADPAPDSRAVLVVCDGVSNSLNSDVASFAAVAAAQQHYLKNQQEWNEIDSNRAKELCEIFRAGAQAAGQAVVDNTALGHPNPPSCTFAAALISDGAVVAGSIGDSRVYWVPDYGDAQLLTTDDSMAQRQIAAGVPREEAESSAQAHVITRWLGRDAPEIAPLITVLDRPEVSGWIVVCTDGLWNYASEAEDFAKVIRHYLPNPDALESGVKGLIGWANQKGGLDNVTVAVARLNGSNINTDSATDSGQN